jgi:hypothetical protein
MDRSWVYNSAPFSPIFLVGLQQFMEHIRGRYNVDEKIKCPCRKCLNQIEKSQVDVQEDIELNGISRCYTRWIHHGEEADDLGLDDCGPAHVVPEVVSWDESDQAPHDDLGLDDCGPPQVDGTMEFRG